eukprot:m.98902 g.98902  ORF g.98902 m.98902 type:complete len:335 (+) comp27110_c0_seq1:325-1329(+)
MTLFTKLSKQIEQLDAKFRELETSSGVTKALEEAVKIVHVNEELESTPLVDATAIDVTPMTEYMGQPWEHLSAIKTVMLEIEPKLLKMELKAKLEGDAKIYNEKKSAQILQVCSVFASLQKDFDPMFAPIDAAWKMVIQAKQTQTKQQADDIERKRKREEAEQLARDKQAIAEKLMQEQALLEAKALAERTAQEHAQREADAFREAKRRQEEAAKAEAALTFQQRVERAKLEAGVPVVAPEPPTNKHQLLTKPLPIFSLQIQVSGPAKAFTVELVDGNDTTIASLKTLIADTQTDLPPDKQIIFAGGRQLNDKWNLKKCRIKNKGTVHVGVKPD